MHQTKTVIKLKDKQRPANKTKMSTQRIPIQDLRAALPEGALSKAPREACQDCTRKHVAQAVILLGEALLGYPEHKWLAIGHLAEASEECLGDYPKVAQMIRKARLQVMENEMPDLMQYLRDDFDLLSKDQDNL